MISLILADAEVERVPLLCSEGKSPPRVCGAKDAELRGIIVLDSYVHGHIMQGLDYAERRGRPDIVHSFLLLAQGSRACEDGKLASFIHTRGGEVITVGRKYRPDQNYIAFLRSLGELFEKGHLDGEEEGLVLERDIDLKALLGRLRPDEVIVLTPSGDRNDLHQVLSGSDEKHLAVIIGGFLEGDYHSPVYQMADVKVSLGDELLTVPDVISQVLAAIP
jgi:rRNA small subunit pseudouridine methyltransferase Nep1